MLADGKKFTKLDLSQAYQQLLVDGSSKKFVTINTYCYNRLPFGNISEDHGNRVAGNSLLDGLY